MKIAKRPALFLDRDGVLITRAFLTWKKNQLKLSPGIAKEIAYFNKVGVPVIVITNQPVVARGLISEEGVKKLHEILGTRMKRAHARIDAFYFCPHHPNANVKKYRIVCNCRKPATGMFLQAAKEWNIDLRKSVMIGDQTQDILAGNRVHAKTILVQKGFGGKDMKHEVKPDCEASDVATAIRVARKMIKK